ncbi:MAG: DUF420 domain-containing protein [Verrucomicrobia bacterium]|nr:DUF420 domain-containing protein [Verrucomicrobiota bacterium]
MTEALPVPNLLHIISTVLNATSTVLLLAGYVAIKKGKRTVHRNIMLCALMSSAIFLCVYLYNHGRNGSTHYPLSDDWTYPVYLAVLLPHILLAALMVPFILRGVWLAWKSRWAEHARLMRVVWPVWLYVSVTGVLVVGMRDVLPGLRT